MGKQFLITFFLKFKKVILYTIFQVKPNLDLAPMIAQKGLST